MKLAACMIVIVGLVQVHCLGADLPTHKFLDKRNVALFSMDAQIVIADLVSTRQALRVPGAREGDPLLRSSTGAVGIRAGQVLAGIGLAYVLHRTGHHRAERIIPFVVGVPSIVAAAHNATIRRK